MTVDDYTETRQRLWLLLLLIFFSVCFFTGYSLLDGSHDNFWYSANPDILKNGRDLERFQTRLFLTTVSAIYSAFNCSLYRFVISFLFTKPVTVIISGLLQKIAMCEASCIQSEIVYISNDNVVYFYTYPYCFISGTYNSIFYFLLYSFYTA